MEGWVAILVGVGLLAGNAFFVAAEFALLSTRRTQIEPLAQEGHRRAKRTLAAMERVTLMLAGAQLGITVCSVLLGAVAEPALAHLIEAPAKAVGVPESVLHPLAFSIALLVIVALHVVVGEMVPKNIALAAPDRSALLLGPALDTLVRLSRPVIAGLNGVVNLMLRAFHIPPQDEVVSAFTAEEVAGLVRESHREGLLEAEEHQLIVAALELDRRRAGDVAIPLDRLVTVPLGATAADVERLAAETGFSRFPVRTDDGGIAGYVHLRDALEEDPAKRVRPLADKYVRPMPPTASDGSLDDVLLNLRRAGTQLARVVDADGRLRGVLALEDVMAQLVGPIAEDARGPRGRRRRI